MMTQLNFQPNSESNKTYNQKSPLKG